jgi:hypothetical protein
MVKLTPRSLTAMVSTVAVVVVGVNVNQQTRHKSSAAGVPESARPNSAVVPGKPIDLFPEADWLWKQIPSDPELAGNSQAWVRYFAEPGTEHIAELYREGVRLIPAEALDGGTPRYDVVFTEPWGPDPFGPHTVPIPLGTQVTHYEGGDGRIAVQDPASGQVFAIWQAMFDTAANTWTGSWGGMAPMSGDGIDTSGSATAAGVSRYAGVVTIEEFREALRANTGLQHALVFATDIGSSSFVPPAKKSDGTNSAGVATPIPQGHRIQLDPALDVDALRGITSGERVVAKTLQTHGAYVIDKGAARMAFSFEAAPDATDSNPGKVWSEAGFDWDYFDMSHIPWAKLRVLTPQTK